MLEAKYLPEAVRKLTDALERALTPELQREAAKILQSSERETRRPLLELSADFPIDGASFNTIELRGRIPEIRYNMRMANW